MLNGFYTVVDRKQNNITYRGYEDGHKVYQKFRFRPTLYLDSKEKDTKWKALDGTPVEPMRFDSMSESRAFIKQYEDIPGFRIHGNDRHIPAFIQAEFPNEIKYDPTKIDVVTLDIEYDSSNGFSEPTEAACEITLITLKSSRLKHYITWGCGDYDQSKSLIPEIKKEYRQFDNENEMLEDFLQWWEDPINCPDVITGWNTRTFDMPYMVNRICRVLEPNDALRLSPWKTVEQKTKHSKWGTDTYFDIHGISQLDYLDLFKKFTVNTYGTQESYKLDFIAELVLGENKLAYDEEYGSLGELYKKNFNLYLDYNVMDVALVERIEEKIGLLSLAFTLAYYGGVNYTDTLGTTAIWEAIIFRYLAKRNIAIPPAKSNFKEDYEGGFVKESISGRHEWVVSFDLNSLYPQLIVQYNMSPETLVKHMKVSGLSPELFLEDTETKCWAPEDNLAIAPNGSCFRRDKAGVLPIIVEEIYEQRVEVKTRMLNAEKRLQTLEKGGDEYRRTEIEMDLASNKQMCFKILLNSLYGATASRFFRYYDIDIAEAITLAGQFVIQSVERSVNNFLHKAVGDKTFKDRALAADTDSCYYNLSDVVRVSNPKDKHKFCVDFAKQALEPIIERTFEDIGKKTNVYRNTMKMKLEKVSSVVIFTKKKRYILKVLSSEGVEYKEPKIVIKGMEAIKSSTPKACRDAFKRIFVTLVDGTEAQMQAEVKEFEEQFNQLKVESFARPCSVTEVKKYECKTGPLPYKKGKGESTPINSRAAILYNAMIKAKGLDKHLPKIKGGDRMKYVYLRKGNPTGENVMGFIDKLPREFDLHDWVDYEELFEKTFLHPLDIVLKYIGWKSKPTASLEDFFS